MQIELKNTDFKHLYEWLKDNINSSIPIYSIITQQLKPQYERAFLKYKNEEQKFDKNEKIQFRFGMTRWGKEGKVENTDWIDGKIYKVSRLANGQYKYIIKYTEDADDYHKDIGQIDKNGMGISYTNPMTEKNIRKFKE